MNIKFPKNLSYKKICKYFIQCGLGNIVKEAENPGNLIKDLRFEKKIYKPNIKSLYKLHKIVLLNKRLKILEYGTGWSTLVFYHALMTNLKRYPNVKKLRVKNPFSIYVIDNYRKYINFSKKRINKSFKKIRNLKFYFCQNKMSKYKKRYCSEYLNHPNLNPDFIYLDGPDQFKIKGKSDNFTISHYDMMPMNSDILKYEHFLNPGTMILADGRTANVRFLMANLQRRWKYKFLKDTDQSILLLDEKPLGRFNKKILDFYKSIK